MTNSSTCSGRYSNDNVTLDRDDQNGAPGNETIKITITKIRSGIYRYCMHNFTNRGTSSSIKLATSGTFVKVYYNDNTTTFSVPNLAGNLWGVFTFDNSSGSFTASDNYERPIDT